VVGGWRIVGGVRRPARGRGVLWVPNRSGAALGGQFECVAAASWPQQRHDPLSACARVFWPAPKHGSDSAAGTAVPSTRLGQRQQLPAELVDKLVVGIHGGVERGHLGRQFLQIEQWARQVGEGARGVWVAQQGRAAARHSSAAQRARAGGGGAAWRAAAAAAAAGERIGRRNSGCGVMCLPGGCPSPRPGASGRRPGGRTAPVKGGKGGRGRGRAGPIVSRGWCQRGSSAGARATPGDAGADSGWRRGREQHKQWGIRAGAASSRCGVRSRTRSNDG